MFSYKFYPNPENCTPCRRVWMVIFCKSDYTVKPCPIHPVQQACAISFVSAPLPCSVPEDPPVTIIVSGIIFLP